MNTYPAYKESGVEWLGKIPSHWKAVKIGMKCFVTKLAGYEFTKWFDYSIGGEIIALRSLNIKNGKLDLSDIYMMPQSVSLELPRSQLNVGDLVMGYIGTLGNVAVIPENNKFHLAPNVAKIVPSKEIISNFLCYFILCSQFQDALNIFSSKTSQPFLSMETIRNIRFTLPPLPEQQAIADFLDRKTAQIDTLIQKKQRQIDLLQEQRTALINHAVTNGLNPDVPMKESGVEWLGEIPSHWEVHSLKRLADLKSGDGITSEEIHETGDYAVYGGNGLRGYSSTYTHEGEFVLIGRQGALCGNINYAKGKFWASEHAVVATPKKVYKTVWFGELLRAMNLNQYSMAAAQPGLSVERISNIQIPVPPIDEQEKIEDFLVTKFKKFDELIRLLNNQVELNKEYRTALISEAVTGKIDVRTAE